MHQIKIQETEYSLRSEWSEIEGDLVLQIMPLIFAPREEAMTELVTVLSDIPASILAAMEVWQFRELMKLTEWVWEQPLVEPIFGDIEHDGRVYALPAKDCTNVSVIEWHHAEGFMASFQAGEFDVLDKLTATVLRKVAFTEFNHFDRREPFDPYRLEFETKRIAGMDIRFKLYALWFIHGCRKNLVGQYPMLFNIEDQKTENVYSFGNEDEVDFGWIGTAYQLAEARVFGDFNAVLRTDIHTVLYYLSWKKQETERANKQMEASMKRS